MLAQTELAQVVAMADGLLSTSEFKVLYRYCLPCRMVNSQATTLEYFLADLNNLPPQVGRTFSVPLLEFVERIATKIHDSNPAMAIRLQLWVDAQAPQLKVTPSEIRTLRALVQERGVYAHVLLDIEPDPHNPEAAFVIRAWSCVDGRCEPIDLPPEDPDLRPRPLLDVRRILTEFLGDLPGYVPEGADVTIEVFLPRPLLCWDIDRWMIQVGQRHEMPVGFHHRLVVRWRDRVKVARIYWNRKWSNVRDGSAMLDSVFWLDSPRVDCNSLYFELFDRNDLYCAGFAFSPPENPDSEDDLVTILNAGVPIALWLRQSANNQHCAKQHILEALKGKSVADLPEAVRAARRQAFKEKDQEHVGNHLTLLWDDASRKLPCSTKSLAQPRLEGGNI